MVWERVMRMSNSSLVTYRHITKHKSSGRGGHKIEKIFVHHMAGILTVKQCGNVFDTRQASAHYGVSGTSIGQYVDEKDTAWHCGNFGWNQRSIGIELANDSGAKTGWHVSDTTINTAIKLIADICRRNGIKKLSYTGNMNGNLCMHRWVCSTSCPGPYLSTQFKRIEVGVNKILGAKLTLDVDGIGGPLTVLRMQEFFGTTMDGVISGQKKANAKYYPSLTEVIFDDTTSTCVKALQKMLGLKQSGILDQETVKAWQKFLGGEITGTFDSSSMKAWQKYLNEHSKAVYPEAPKPATPAPKPSTPSKPKPQTAAEKLAQCARDFAYATNTKKADYKTGKPKAAYKKALKKYYPDHMKWSHDGCSCDAFQGTCVRASGNGKDCPRGLSVSYLVKSKHFTEVHPKSVKDLHDGDIIIRYDPKTQKGHTCIFCDGKIKEASNKDFWPKTTNTAKARLGAKGARVFRAK